MKIYVVIVRDDEDCEIIGVFENPFEAYSYKLDNEPNYGDVCVEVYDMQEHYPLHPKAAKIGLLYHVDLDDDKCFAFEVTTERENELEEPQFWLYEKPTFKIWLPFIAATEDRAKAVANDMYAKWKATKEGL